MSNHERVEQIILRKPGLTDSEIAFELFGKSGYRQRVNPYCRQLEQWGRIVRQGDGGPKDPYRYFKAEANTDRP